MTRFGRIVIGAALLLAAFAGVWPKLWAESGERSHYVHQARAFLHGRLDIPEPFGDVATYRGRHYVVFPPFPAVLITPLVAVFGSHTRTTIVSLALTLLNLFLLRGILRRLELEGEPARWRSTAGTETGRYICGTSGDCGTGYQPVDSAGAGAGRYWLLAGFFLGTAYTTSLFQTYESWHYAHIVAVTCLLLAVYEVLGKGRAVLVGLCCGLAFLSRHLCIYAIIFLAAMLWQRRRNVAATTRIIHLLALAVPVGLCVAIYLYLNWLRFGDPLDTGYSHLPLEGFLQERVAQYGLFHPAYVPFNLVHMFFQGFHISFAPPTFLSVEGLDPFGTSITFASPFVFFAVLARWDRPRLWAAWLSIALPILHVAFYHNNGFRQANAQRFVLDFLPILIVLVALGIRRVKPHWWKAAIGYSIALNVLALFLVSILQRLTALL